MGSFGGALSGFAKGFKGGYEAGVSGRRQDLDEYRYGRPPKDEVEGQGGVPKGGSLPATQPGTDSGTTGSVTPGEIAWNEADPTQRAFLNTLAGPESGGEYNIIYGGDHFEDYSKHPGVYKPIESGPNKGKKSSAAGKYQFLESTWNDIAHRYRLPDFSPANQDKAAWYLAAETYARTQGRSLSTDLQSGDPKVLAGIGKALSPIWTSLPSGIEAGTTTDKFVSTYNNYLQSAPDPTKTASTEGGVLPEPGEKAAAAAAPTAQASLLDADTSGQMDADIVKVAERAARDNPGLFALNPDTKTLRTQAEQDEMVKKGWSQTRNSKHLKGKAVDLVPINPATGKPDANYAQGYDAISKAMRKAAQDEGVSDLSWGGDWKSFQDKPHWQVSQLEQEQQLQPGAPQSGWQEDPTMFAAEGGVIPETPAAPKKVDPYFSGRAMTQISNPTPASTFTPRRVGQAQGAAAGTFTPRKIGQTTGTYGVTPGQPTASQLAFRNRPVAAAPVAAAPVAAPVPQTYKVTDAVKGLAHAKAQTASSAGHQQRINREIANWQRLVDQERAAATQGFARGGKVASPSRRQFEGQERRERTMSSRGEEAGQGSRDKAARRFTEGRSTAIDPDGYWTKPAKPRVKDTPRGRGGSTDPTTTGSTTPTSIIPALPGQTELQGVPPDLQPKVEDQVNAIPLPGQTELQGAPPDLVSGSVRVGAPRPGDPPVPKSRTGQPMTDVETTPTSPRPSRAALPTSPKDTRPQQPRPEGGSGQRTGAAPVIPESNRMYSTAAPYAPIVGQPAYTGVPLPPEEEVEPGAWINGQFVPMSQAGNVTGAGMFASGGIIPEDPLESDRADAAAYQRPQFQQPQQQERPEPEDRQPTPRLMADVGQAVKGGMDFLKRTFGLDGGGGAIETPESGGVKAQGVRRLMSGEGAADQQEIQAVYDKVDPERQMSEGDRYMDSMAKTMQWYLMNGRKDDAEGAAASLMQYGSRKFSQLGALAGEAYKEYQQTGDKAAMDRALGFLEKAYEFIPDGGSFDILSVDPETGKIMTTKRNADGSEDNVEIDPAQLPGLLQQVQSGSAYWSEISRLADPEGARQKDRQKHELEVKREDRRYKEAETKETRTYEEGQKEKERAATSAENDRIAKRNADIARQAKLDSEALLRGRPPTGKNGETIDINSPEIKSAWDEYWSAQTTLQQLEEGADDTAALAAVNTAGSKLFELVDDPKWLEDRGIEIGEGGFTPVPTAGPRPEGLPAAAELAPDGNYYVPKPGGGYQKVIPKKAAAPAAG